MKHLYGFYILNTGSSLYQKEEITLCLLEWLLNNAQINILQVQCAGVLSVNFEQCEFDIFSFVICFWFFFCIHSTIIYAWNERVPFFHETIEGNKKKNKKNCLSFHMQSQKVHVHDVNTHLNPIFRTSNILFSFSCCFAFQSIVVTLCVGHNMNFTLMSFRFTAWATCHVYW